MRRLFSTFAPGWPGAGLLMMRLVAGSALLAHWWPILRYGAAAEMALAVVGLAAGVLLLVGLWTPIVGTITAILAGSHAVTHSQPGDPWTHILLGTFGAALALVGPGAWSIDARLFGWKRIDVASREQEQNR